MMSRRRASCLFLNDEEKKSKLFVVSNAGPK
jgi:hypothetical protein